jgi:hypothetical protein
MSNYKEICLQSDSTNPYEILLKLMRQPDVPMHGPVHHILDGAAFMTAMYNAVAEFDLDAALDELAVRGAQMPGATCGKWGVCGAASSVGAALAIIHGTGPLTDSEYYQDNLRLTSRILAKIGERGGPRCCKRNGFTALDTAVEFVEERYSIRLEQQKTECCFSQNNPQCIEQRCPYHK